MNKSNTSSAGGNNYKTSRRAFSHVTNEHRPLLRGWVHAVAVLMWVPLSIVLIGKSDEIYRKPLLIYVTAVFATLAISAYYHILAISKKKQQLWQRIDHAGVFILILGSYVPISYAVLSFTSATLLIIGVAILSVIGGILRGLGKSKKFASSLYIVTGWFGLLILPELLKTSVYATLLIFIGGVSYTIGAVFFKIKWPYKNSTVFGYHEVFHLCTLLGVLSQYCAILILSS